MAPAVPVYNIENEMLWTKLQSVGKFEGSDELTKIIPLEAKLS